MLRVSAQDIRILLGVSDYDLNNDHVRYFEMENNTIIHHLRILVR